MVTVRLKGIHVIRTKLADGSVAEYHYAWKGKGAPRLTGPPGSPAYLASFQDAHGARKTPTTGTLLDVIAAFKVSAEYKKLGEHTRRAYVRYLDQIQAKWGTMPLAAVDDPQIRRKFLTWRDSMADRPRTADYAVGTLKLLLGWAKERVYIHTNQAEPISRLHTADRSDSIWTPEHFEAFAAEAGKELGWAVQLAAYTGLRQGDLIRLPWSAYDGTSFTYRTAKRGKQVLIPATAACRTLMATIQKEAKRGPVILTTARGKTPWTADGLRASFNAARKRAGVKRTFHDLRRTAATNLLKANVEAPTVALIMGWEEAAVDALKRKYVSRSAVVADMLAKMEPTV